MSVLIEKDKLEKLLEEIDAVRVVRCKDCKRGRKTYLSNDLVVVCGSYNYEDTRRYKDPMDYCSRGVRRDDGA